jgi:hypothetical protein
MFSTEFIRHKNLQKTNKAISVVQELVWLQFYFGKNTGKILGRKQSYAEEAARCLSRH